jgi:hypothetical protein
MKFKKNNKENIGKYLGFIVMFFIFNTILYFILTILEKLPQNWNYFHLTLVTLIIIIIGTLIKIWLK